MGWMVVFLGKISRDDRVLYKKSSTLKTTDYIGLARKSR